jgi:YVTN family beta-propeller protein
MPAVTDPCNIYSADSAGHLSQAAQTARSLIYVPNGLSNTVDEIDPATYRVVREFGVGALPQHVVPSWDLKTLWVTNDQGNSLTPVDPITGNPGSPVHVEDPYNMYFTPDGRYAIVVAEALRRLDFRDPHTMALVRSLPVPCHGVDHMDFSTNGTYLIASCEFSGELLKVDVASQSVVGTISPGAVAEPQDVKLSPDGKVFFVADLKAGGVWKVDGDSFSVLGFLPTGKGAHGLYVSRNAQYLYVSNRDAGTISVISFATGHVAATWTLPPETGNHLGRGNDIASPDMGGVSADGKVLWLSGRYDSDVYAIDTATGQQIARIPVGGGPHGLCVWPQPGRYSLGHTGILR